MSNPNQAPVMENPGVFERLEATFRNSRLGQMATVAMASMSMVGTAEAYVAEPVAAENVPAQSSSGDSPITGDPYVPKVVCESTDSTKVEPQWRVSTAFKTPNGKEDMNDVHPGGVARFVARVAGGNLAKFDLGINIYGTPKYAKILKKGSHPAWTPAGGDPSWRIEKLCHWKDKRTISFLVKVDAQARPGQLCIPYNVSGTTGYAEGSNLYNASGTKHECIVVK